MQLLLYAPSSQCDSRGSTIMCAKQGHYAVQCDQAHNPGTSVVGYSQLPVRQTGLSQPAARRSAGWVAVSS